MFFDNVKYSGVFQVIELFRQKSLNLLLSLSSRSISESKECLKVRFGRDNREKLLLECRRSSSKSRNEKPLIRQSIGSFQLLSRVRILVFLLISLPITSNFIFES